MNDEFDTTPIQAEDAKAGFSCGKHPLDDYFARHAVSNDALGISRAFVLRRAPSDDAALPAVLGFYTLSMASAESAPIAAQMSTKLPRYPAPVALIGRLAIDRRAAGRRFGEKLLLDAFRRIREASMLMGCLGVIVDAKDEDAARFYDKYGFVRLTPGEEWPQRMFLPIATIRQALDEDGSSPLGGC